MIYTTVLNPTLDVTMEVEELVYDDANRIVETRKRAGGKGIDVARVIRELGGSSIVIGFAGGYAGRELEGMLIGDGIVCDFTGISAETKANTVIYQRKKKVETFLGSPEPAPGPFEVATFFEKIKGIPRDSLVVVTGNPPQGIDESFYAQVVTTLKARGVKVFLDADGEVYGRGVNAGPYLIKPNIHEFGRLVERNVTDAGEIVECAAPYRDLVPYIVVSMGARGVVGLSDEGDYIVTPPKVKVRNSIGAGDSLLGGLVYSFSMGRSFEDALVLGCACGTASTLNPENGLCAGGDIENIKKDIIVKKF
jgi:1-phosphofructokinase family hexose kinase